MRNGKCVYKFVFVPEQTQGQGGDQEHAKHIANDENQTPVVEHEHTAGHDGHGNLSHYNYDRLKKKLLRVEKASAKRETRCGCL